MALLVPNVGEEVMLKRIVGLAIPEAGGGLTMRLFSSNTIPAEDTTGTALSEVSSGGYTQQALTATSWSVNTISGVTEATHAQVSFDFAGSATVYGYYVTDAAGIILWIERFTDAPYNIPSGGGSVKITPKIQLD